MTLFNPGVPPVQLFASDQFVLILPLASTPLQITVAAVMDWVASHKPMAAANRSMWDGDRLLAKILVTKFKRQEVIDLLSAWGPL